MSRALHSSVKRGYTHKRRSSLILYFHFAFMVCGVAYIDRFMCCFISFGFCFPMLCFWNWNLILWADWQWVDYSNNKRLRWLLFYIFFFIFRSLFRSYGFFVLFYCTHYVYYKVKMECRERFLKEATIRKISSSKTHIEPIDKEQKRQNNFRSSNFYAKDNFWRVQS